MDDYFEDDLIDAAGVFLNPGVANAYRLCVGEQLLRQPRRRSCGKTQL